MAKGPGFEGFKEKAALLRSSDIKILAWSPRGSEILGVSEKGDLFLWFEPFNDEPICLYDSSLKIRSLAWSPKGESCLIGDSQGVIRFISADNGRLIEAWEEHLVAVSCISTSNNGLVAFGAEDGIVTFRRFINESHIDDADIEAIDHAEIAVTAMEWDPRGRLIAVGLEDGTINIYDSSDCAHYHAYRGHAGAVYDLHWSLDGGQLVSAGADGTVRVWTAGRTKHALVLEGHAGEVTSVSLSSDQHFLASSSTDGTVRIWSVDQAAELLVLGIPSRAVRRATTGFSPNQSLITIPTKGGISIFRADHTVINSSIRRTNVEYKNAKVVLCGNTTVGKTGLSLVLTRQPYRETDSSHARRILKLENITVRTREGRDQMREVLLWDLAGQPGYRVMNQLHLNEAAIGLVVFDSRSEIDPFFGVPYWTKALDEAASNFPIAKFLVAARSDRGGKQVSQTRINEVVSKYGFSGYVETSARKYLNIDDLRNVILNSIRWDDLPTVVAPEAFYRLREFVISLRGAGAVLLGAGDLLDRFRYVHVDQVLRRDEFDVCIGRLEAAGLIRRLAFGGQLLLQPELLDEYCAWLAMAARDEPDGLGTIPEKAAQAGQFAMDDDRTLAGHPEEEAQLLFATVHEVVARGIARREETENGAMLIFPSELRAESPEFPGEHNIEVAFQFEGPVSAIYAILAVRLINSLAYEKERLFKNAAVFKAPGQQICGIAAEYPDLTNEGIGRLVVFFEAGTPRAEKLHFLRYIDVSLQRLALNGSVQRERIYQFRCEKDFCPRFSPTNAVVLACQKTNGPVKCPVCSKTIAVDDFMASLGARDVSVTELDQKVEAEQSRQARKAIMGLKEAERDFHVLLSYNSLDGDVVQDLEERLRAEGVLSWLDIGQVGGGRQFTPKLEKAISTTPAIAILIGADGLGPWQQQEYFAAIQRYVESPSEGVSIKLIPVLLPNAPRKVTLPPFLKTFSLIDFRVYGGFDHAGAFKSLLSAVLEGK